MSILTKINKKAIFLLTFFAVFFLFSFLFANVCLAGSAHLTWNANTESDLDGYFIYYDTSSHAGTCPSGYAHSYEVTNAGATPSHDFTGLTNGETYYFAITAYDTSDNESDCSSEVSKLITAVENAPVYRFWSNQKQGHFYTISEAEKDHVIDAYDDDEWLYEGEGYDAFAESDDGLTPVYRFWSEQKQGHFYTASEAEKDHVIDFYDDNEWLYEGIAFYVYATEEASTTPVYRFWSNQKQHHFYTSSEAEKDHVIDFYDDDEWLYEGEAWYVPEG